MTMRAPRGRISQPAPRPQSPEHSTCFTHRPALTRATRRLVHAAKELAGKHGLVAWASMTSAQRVKLLALVHTCTLRVHMHAHI